MRISTSNANRLINKFEEAVRADEFKGAAHPDDQDAIEKKYKDARKKLFKFFIDCVVMPESTSFANVDELNKGK